MFLEENRTASDGDVNRPRIGTGVDEADSTSRANTDIAPLVAWLE
jgi:hypothetical protein